MSNLFYFPVDLYIFEGNHWITNVIKKTLRMQQVRGFPGGTVVKNPPANAGDTGSSPGPGRSHMLQSN